MLRGKHSQVLLLGPFAIKIFKPNMKLNTKKEWYFLRLLQKKGIAPRPYLKVGRFVVMERIKGTPVREMSAEIFKQHAVDFVEALHTLDMMGVQKEECHRPNRHFILTQKGIRLIDFERSKLRKAPSNVTQFLQFLNLHFPGIRKLGKPYKKTYQLAPIVSFIRKAT
ncbi:MAG: hypothetical protein GOV00_00610 [Candidatus Altiarchaeota archaeon]|nr:hypothetical protein [Candidatus Altiarchaeota archaeon]